MIYLFNYRRHILLYTILHESNQVIKSQILINILTNGKILSITSILFFSFLKFQELINKIGIGSQNLQDGPDDSKPKTKKSDKQVTKQVRLQST